VHVPFCRVRCPYCDFATAPYAQNAAAAYVGAVEREAEAVRPFVGTERFQTVFFGGGTPSRLEADDFRRLSAAIATRLPVADDAEWSLEANPEDVDEARLDAWAAASVQRVSLGVQATEARHLRALGRPHDPELARQAARAVAECFPTWSLDLLFGFPGHDEAAWAQALDEVLALDPPHLSLYHFTAESGTVLGDAVLADRVRVPGEDGAARLLEMAAERLADAGFEHYEISNFARPGHRSRHNTLYWQRGDCLGLGPGAVSTWGSTRWTNCRNAATYTAEVLGGRPWVEEVERVGPETLREIFLVGLRLAEGVPWSRLETLGKQAEPWRRAASALAREGVLVCDDMGVRVSPHLRRLTDAIVLRLWTLAEGEEFRASGATGQVGDAGSGRG
jgi:oxygen-independent coproporphyrinogen-3 oxidase